MSNGKIDLTLDPNKKIEARNAKIINIAKKVSIGLLVVIILVLVAFLAKNVIKKEIPSQDGSVTKSSESTGTLQQVNQYYKARDPWDVFKPVNFVFPEKNGFKVPGTDQCQVYTYENIFADEEYGSSLDVTNNVKPNINSVFLDYVNGLNHIGGDFKCISQDQIEAQNVSKTCKNDNSTFNSCYLSSGEIVQRGVSITYPYQCTNLPKCTGKLGSLSLNFGLEELFDQARVNGNTKCIGISTISVPTDYNTLYPQGTDLQFYENSGLIKVDTTLPPETTSFPVTLKNETCNPRAVSQKLLFNRYTFGETQQTSGNTSSQELGYKISDTGLYTEILFKPLNAYLDYEFSGTGSISSLKLVSGGKDYPSGSFGYITSLKENGLPSLSNRANVSFDVTQVNKSVIKGSIIIIEGGSDYQQGQQYFISKGTCPYNEETDALVEVISVYETNPNLVLRKRNTTSIAEGIKWMFFPQVDLSSVRYPITQRCNFLNPTTLSNGDYTILSTTLQENQLFNKTNINGAVKQSSFSVGNIEDLVKSELLPGYCQDFTPNYPSQTFQNLTPGCKLNPTYFYDYIITTIDGDNIQLPSTDPLFFFIPDNPESVQNYTTGSTITDGTCKVQVLDFANNICEFSPEYFQNSNGSVTNFETLPRGVNTTLYKESDTGLVISVDVNEQPKSSSGNFVANTYTGISPVSQTTNSGGTTQGSGVIFDVSVGVGFNPNTSINSPIVSVDIKSTGSNYNIGDLLTLKSSEIGLSGYSNPVIKVVNVETEKFIFKAIPTTATASSSSNGTLSSTPESASIEEFPVRDLSFIGSITNNSLQISSDSIVNRGFNYSILQTVFLYQLSLTTKTFIDSTYQQNIENYISNTVSTATSSLSELISIIVTDILGNEYSGLTPAPHSLLPENNNSEFIKFNFLAESGMKLNPAPPQMVYGAEIFEGNQTLIDVFGSLQINKGKDIENFFISTKAGGRETSVTYLKSLQYEALKYTPVNNNEISTQSNIILGKYIPYTSFTPMENVPGSNSDLPTGVSGTLYNNNFSVIIPYGLNDLYNTNITLQNIQNIN